MASTEQLTFHVMGGGSSAALSVTELTYHLGCLVREDLILQDVWIRGEVSNLTRASSGHLYFSLKDDGACISCVMWRIAAGRVPFRLNPGMQVLAHGALDVYPPRGQYQLVIDEVQPDGAGALHVALEQAKARLLAEGLLAAERKRPLPLFPERVLVITSLEGAAVRDICTTFKKSPYLPEIVLIGARVQGAASEETLCSALRQANVYGGADVIILGRGGGSAEDLWTFNSERLARAIIASKVPVISAVGHETDFTLADMAADHRAPTPTAAAEMIVAQRLALIERAGQATAQARALLTYRLETARLRLEGICRRRSLTHPEWIVETRRQELDDANARLHRAWEAWRQQCRHRLAMATGKLEALSPLGALSRGFAEVRRLPGETSVTSIRQLQTGDSVRVQLTDGSFEASVTSMSNPATQPPSDPAAQPSGAHLGPSSIP